MASHITIRPARGLWVVRAGGAVIAESPSALELAEGGYDPVIYFPRSDIGMAFLDKSATTSHCPHKGKASYYTLAVKSGTIADAGWSYESPLPDMEPIRDHIAFYPDKVTIERL